MALVPWYKRLLRFLQDEDERIVYKVCSQPYGTVPTVYLAHLIGDNAPMQHYEQARQRLIKRGRTPKR